MKINYVVCILLLSISSLYSAGKSSLKYPVWIDNPESKYSSGIYLSALGTGENREIAVDKAFARLSQLFGVDIKADNRSEERYISSLGSSTSIKNDINLASKHTLINAKISETYFDYSGKTYYALATMEKMPTSILVNKEIEKNNKIINDYLNMAEQEKDAIYKYSLYDLAAIIAERNEIFSTQMPMLSGFDANIKHISSATIINKANEVRRNISFYAETSDNNASIKKTIENVFSSMGYTIASTKNKASYILKESTSYIGNDTGYGIYIVNYTTAISFDNQYGENLTSFSFTGKQGGNDEEDAKRIVRIKLSNDIPKTLSVEFNKYFDSVIKLK